MNKEERKLIKEIYQDCIKLKKRGELTEFGKGQMILAGILLRKCLKTN